jgi:hypothetical protein
VLWSKEEEAIFAIEQLAGKAVGVATYLLEHIERKDVVRHTEVALAIAEEVALLARQHREYIVVEVEILLVEIGYAMKEHLYRVTVEYRQELGWDDILVKHDVHLVTIHPLGYLALVRYHKMHLAHERHILGYTTKEVLQSAPISKTLLQYRLVGVLLVVALPHRVQTIHIGDYYIHRSLVFATFVDCFIHKVTL